MSLDDIRARLAAATPGPWFSDRDGWIDSEHGEGYVVGVETSPRESDADLVTMPEADRELITNAPSDMAALLSALDVVQELARVRQNLGYSLVPEEIQHAIAEALA